MRLVILGQSVSAMKAVEAIRLQDKEMEITVVAFDPNPAANRHLFPALVAHQLTRANVMEHDQKFYQDCGITVISDKKINRINFNRKTIFFEDKDRLEYDRLVIAAAEKDVFPEIKGTNREGIFSLRTLAQVDQLNYMAGQLDAVIVESDGINGIRFALAMQQQGKETILCLPTGKILPGVIDDEVSEMTIGFLQQAGIRVLRSSRINEILGEHDVKAVRLNSGKVLAAEAVVYPDALPDLRAFRSDDLTCTERIATDDVCRTSVPEVFAIDEVADLSVRLRSALCDPEAWLRQQADRLLAGLQQRSFEGQALVMNCHIDIPEHPMDLLGDAAGGEGVVAYDARDEQGLLLKRIFVKNNVVVGAIFRDNSAGKVDVLEVLLQEGLSEERLAGLVAGCQRQEPGQPVPAQSSGASQQAVLSEPPLSENTLDHAPSS